MLGLSFSIAVMVMGLPLVSIATAILYKAYFDAISRNPDAKIPLSQLILGLTFIEMPMLMVFVMCIMTNGESDKIFFGVEKESIDYLIEKGKEVRKLEKR